VKNRTPRAGCRYVWQPTGLDLCDERLRDLEPGTIVRVIPPSRLGIKCGTMPQAFRYIEDMSGREWGLCCSASLAPIPKGV
jgi:hypothetical protein